MSGLVREPGKARCHAIPSSDVSKTCLGSEATRVTPSGTRKLPEQQGGAGLSKGTEGAAEGRPGRVPWAERAPECWTVPAPLSALIQRICEIAFVRDGVHL